MMPSPQQAVTIRTPREADHPRLAELATQLGYPSTSQDVARRIAALNAHSQYTVFVAEIKNGVIAGWICVVIHQTLESDPYAEITGLIVDEAHRSHRVGQKLVLRAEEWAREQGCNQARVRSNVIRDRAHAFYLRNGYEHCKTQKVFRKNL
jgi:GNAT superfamily N-acetyltransferase